VHIRATQNFLENPIDAPKRRPFNLTLFPDAKIAQLVEQRTENPRVLGSIPSLGTTFKTRFPFDEKAGFLLMQLEPF
jgi:hypothetical protein